MHRWPARLWRRTRAASGPSGSSTGPASSCSTAPRWGACHGPACWLLLHSGHLLALCHSQQLRLHITLPKRAPPPLPRIQKVFWTREVSVAIESAGADGLKAYTEKCTGELNKIVNLVRGQLTSLERATCGSLVVIDVHARDVVAEMAEKGVSDIRDFNWWVGHQ